MRSGIVLQERPEDLSRQSLGRPLTEAEQNLAQALTAIFATGQHNLAKVAEELDSRGVARPSGEPGAWSIETLEREVTSINASLDAAHDAGGITLVG